MTIQPQDPKYTQKVFLYSALTLLGAVAFSAAFAVVNYWNYTWLSPQFERSTNPTVWGILQRLFLIIPIIAAAVWRPREIGLQTGKIRQYWRMLLIMLAANVGIVGGYLALTGATPYSGWNMLINEVITVPLVEEFTWRGIVFAALLAALRRRMPEEKAGMLAAVFSGICFGLLHANNAFFGYPAAFVAIQVLNACVWGVVYGIARAKTGSLYPPIWMHAAMNLAAALA